VFLRPAVNLTLGGVGLGAVGVGLGRKVVCLAHHRGDLTLMKGKTRVV
jgi:hypothetical protein